MSGQLVKLHSCLALLLLYTGSGLWGSLFGVEGRYHTAPHRALATYSQNGPFEMERPEPQPGDISAFGVIRQKKSARVKLCGDQLVQMLFLVCGYYDNVAPKANTGFGEDQLRQWGILDRKKRSVPFGNGLTDSMFNINREQMSSYTGKRETGLAERCCINACTYTELLGACN